MPNETFLWLSRIKAVEKEHQATQFATDRVVAEVKEDPTILQGALRPRDIVHAANRLDGTYLIRLFAEFETGLRLFWQKDRGTRPPSRTQDLLDGIAARRRIPNEQLANAHAVREYRNCLVHEREEDTDPIPIEEARGYLCRFFGFCPRPGDPFRPIRLTARATACRGGST